MGKLIAALIAGLIGTAGFAADTEPLLSPEVCKAKRLKASAEIRAIADMMQRDADYSEANNGRLSPELEQEYVQWYQRESAKPGSQLPELWRTDLTATERARRSASVDQFSSYSIAKIKGVVGAILRDAAKGCSPPQLPKGN